MYGRLTSTTMTRLVLLSCFTAAGAFDGVYFSGCGLGDGEEWLQALDTARAQFSPNPILQSLDMLYTTIWNGLIEGPTWNAWWTQNSYGTTFASLPFLAEPHRTFVRNANWLWFEWIGDGKRVGLDDPHAAPDGCLCDASTPGGAYYKQGDGNVPIHDWALEETLSAIVMQGEQCLQERDLVSINQTYLPLFTRTINLIESRLDENGLFLIGDAANLLAPSGGGWLLPNGTRAFSWLTGVSVTYVAAMDRVIELRKLVGDVAGASRDTAARDAAIVALSQLLAPAGDYFVKSMDPDSSHTMHGVLGQSKHGYIEAVVNHDAVAFGVADRVRTGLGEQIMARLLGDTVPVNPVTNGPGLRPYSLVITNAASLDDMEYPPTSWLWQYGTWVNGGEWATCEARMMLAYARTNRSSYSLDSFKALMGYASIFRMDSPLVAWGSGVYEPNEPINTVVDMWAIPAALIRGLWGPSFAADSLTLTPQIPVNISNITQKFPLVWGDKLLFVSAAGVGPISGVLVDDAPLPSSQWNASTMTLLWDALPTSPANVSVVISFGNQSPGSCNASASTPASVLPTAASALSIETSIRVLRTIAVLPEAPILWLDATTFPSTTPSGSGVSNWPDLSGFDANASQPVPALQPLYNPKGMSGRPSVDFDGVSTFLAGSALSLPAQSTIVAMVSNAAVLPQTSCCSGIFYSAEGCNGLGMKNVPPTSDDAVNATVLSIDWSGSPDSGIDDLTGRQAMVVAVTYNSTGSYSWASGCLQSTEGINGAIGGPSFMVGSRNNEDGRFFHGSISELIIFGRPLNETELDSVSAYLVTKWPPPAPQPPLQCFHMPNCTLSELLMAAQAHVGSFIPALYAAGFISTRYELAHAQLCSDSIASWQTRCAGLHSGAISPLANKASEAAADALYVSTPTNLYNGLAAVISSYSNSSDPSKAEIYALWNSTLSAALF